MSRRQLSILAGLGGFIVLIAVWGLLGGGPMLPGVSVWPAGTGGEEGGEAASDGVRPAYRAGVPAGAAPTAPTLEAPAAPGSSARLGIFAMRVSENGYEPSTLTVELGNLVQIRLTAADGDYDFSMPWSGLYQSVKDGETKQISFQTTSPGTYLFECRDWCPPGKKISGQLIVISSE